MVDLLAAPDKRGFAGAQSLEPAAAPALAEHTEGPDPCRQSFELDLTEALVLEQAADQPPRILGNDDFVRFGEHLQPRGKVWRLADDRLFSGGPRSDQIADHREPGSKADTDFQQLACFKSAYCLDHGEAGAHRALRIILMRSRVAEIGEHAIAHVPGDEPIELADDIVDGAKVLVDNLAQILGVEPRGERSAVGAAAARFGVTSTWLRSAAIASRSLRRWPPSTTPRSLRSSVVSLGSASQSISLSRKAASYRSRPKPRSHAAMSIRRPRVRRAAPLRL